MHYRRDVTFHEDAGRTKNWNLAQAFAVIHNLVLAILTQPGHTNLAQARRHYAAHPDEALRLLCAYWWPGNIRELENLVVRLAVVCDSPLVEESDLPLEVALGAGLAREAERESSYDSAMTAFEKGYLRKILGQVGWNRRRAAEKLGHGKPLAISTAVVSILGAAGCLLVGTLLQKPVSPTFATGVRKSLVSGCLRL